MIAKRNSSLQVQVQESLISRRVPVCGGNVDLLVLEFMLTTTTDDCRFLAFITRRPLLLVISPRGCTGRRFANTVRFRAHSDCRAFAPL